MRTTLVIDDVVLKAARRQALELDLTLSDLVERALRKALEEDRGPPEATFRLPTWGDPAKPTHHEPASLNRLLEDEDAERLGGR